MSIDWVTTLAQLLNFAVLVWLLQRFLYQPILKAIARREKEIQTRLDEASKTREQAEEDRAACRAEYSDIQDKKAEYLAAARVEASTIRSSLIEAVKQDAESAREALVSAANAEKRDLLQEAVRMAGRQIGMTTEAILQDLVGLELEPTLALHWLKKLEESSDNTKGLLVDAGDIKIISANPLPDNVQGRIIDFLSDRNIPAAHICFDTHGGDTPGLQITIGTKTFEWSLDQYLSRFRDVLEKELQLPSPVTPKASVA